LVRTSDVKAGHLLLSNASLQNEEAMTWFKT
jgi:hypothetical protein